MSGPTLPSELVEARRTPLFDSASPPRADTDERCNTVWAQLFVQSGTVRYTDLEGASPRDIGLGSGDRAVIEPEVRHRIEPSTDAMFYIQFYRTSGEPLVPGSVPTDSRHRAGPWEHRGRDLDTSEQMLEMVTRQYVDVAHDDLLARYFDFPPDSVDWPAHVESVADYWCHVVLYAPDYQIDVIEAHRPPHDADPFTPALFDRWLEIFHDTVDSGWSGAHAERAKQRAAGTASVMARRFLGTGTWRPARHR